jgi:integrase
MIRKYNPKNVRLIKKFISYLEANLGLNPATITGAKRALKEYQTFTRFADFDTFSVNQVKDFKESILKRNLSKTTLLHYMNDLKRFFEWLSQESGYKSKIDMRDIQSLRLSNKETRMIKMQHDLDYAQFDDCQAVIRNMPSDTLIQRRDRGLMALMFMTACRDSALSTLRIKHFDKANDLIIQDPTDVKTKNAKLIHTYLIKAVGNDIYDMFKDYYFELINDYDFTDNDPLFPKTNMIQGHDFNFTPNGLTREFWTTASPIRKIFKQAFEAMDLPYYPPHRIRKTLTAFAQKNCKTPEQFKAFSQNLGHESPLTTFTAYGKICVQKQGELIKGLGHKIDNSVLSQFSKDDLFDALKAIM